MRNPSRHVYSRYTQQVSSRVEQILSRINVSDVEASCTCLSLMAVQDGFALTYSSGLAASYAVRILV